MKTGALAACAVVLAACQAHPTAQANATLSPTPTAWAQPSPSATSDPSAAPDPSHVFVLVLENRSYSQVVGTSYIAQLASQYGLASNYRGISHPSLPNYLAMTSGSTWGVADDGWHNLPAGGLGA